MSRHSGSIKAGVFALFVGLTCGSGIAQSVQYLKGKIENSWVITSGYAEIRQSQLYLDAISDKNRLAAFNRYNDYIDSSMSATFRVERTGRGDKPFGLIFGSTDSQTYMAVEVRKGGVRLVSFAGGKEEKEFRKYAIRDAGDIWQTVSFSCLDTLVRVSYGGKEIFTVNLPKRPTGRFGIYAEDARVWVNALDIQGKAARLPKAWTLVSATPREPKEQ